MKSDFWHDFRAKAARAPQRLVLADGEDERAVDAAIQSQRECMAEPTLIGKRAVIDALWKKHGGEGPAPLVDPRELSTVDREFYLQSLKSVSKFKTLTGDALLEKLLDPLVFGCLYLKNGRADGFIGGASRTTADTLRAVFPIIGLAPRTSVLFGFFFLENKQAAGRENSVVILADCAVSPEPSPKQLASIAIGAGDAYEFFTGRPSRTAFLSFSTGGSAEHPKVDAIRQARDLARAKAPARLFDGEWQGDAALDVFSARIKGVGESTMAGAANVLVVPDLSCGNIAYKLVQRLGDCRAVGPVLWGTALPANDLSRGCSSEDILDLMALTSAQALARARVRASASSAAT